jgi:DNA polymerase-3 subunit epsilon
LLAEVYVELIGARQAQLILSQTTAPILVPGATITIRQRPAPLAPRVSAAEQEAHRQFIATLGEAAIWRDYISLG